MRFVVIGDQSLTIACATELRERSHQIIGIVTDAAAVKDWAATQDVSIVARSDLSRLTPFDYLLSIANLRVLTEAELELPEKGAINFHDGPLPEMSGVNTPSWAILQGMTRYGVTWHEMTPDTDRGSILVSERFDLEPDETSVSLNTRCFHAGFRCFQTLLGQIEDDALQPAAQASSQERLYFPKWKRPMSACVLKWDDGAQSIDALVRSLDFGSYENPLGIAKVRLPGEPAAVGKVKVLPDRSSDAPGTIVEVANNWIRVATSTNDVRISRLSSLTARPVPRNEDRIRLVSDVGLKPGDRLNDAVCDHPEELDRLTGLSARAEHHWVERLETFDPLALPASSDKQMLDASIELPRGLAGTEKILGAIAVFLGRMFQTDEVGLWLEHSRADFRVIPDLFLDYVPCSIALDWSSTLRGLVSTIRHELDVTAGFAPPLCDIGLRYPALQETLKCVASRPVCSVSLDGTAGRTERAPNSRRLHFALSEDTEAIRVSTSGVFEPGEFERFVERFRVMLGDLAIRPDISLGSCAVMTPDDLDLLRGAMGVAHEFEPRTVHSLFRQQAAATPHDVAVTDGVAQLSYAELDRDSDRVALALTANGVEPGDLVGIMMGRRIELPTVMLGVIKAGAAYVPLDRNYPADRLQFIIGDCRPKLVVVDHAPAFSVDSTPMIPCRTLLETALVPEGLSALGEPSDLMYVIYTSGSTGKPKGVQVRHENVHNFFAGIDERIGPEPGTLLAATSISFDISVLELFWTLCRGFKVVLYDDDGGRIRTQRPDQPIGFSLFFWNVADTEPLNGSPYQLLMRAARYADEHGFEAVWTPERHFGSFGGYYPNPSVISAALAASTTRVSIRAGSCVLPLHHPVRVAEEWSVVDNLSGGRIGVSMASGWNPNDFVLRPDSFDGAKDQMFESIEQVRRLWRGEGVTFDGPRGPVEVKALPRPVQQEIPIWVTAAGNPETFRRAGEIGAGILTHLLGQTIEKVAANIQIYRDAWRAGGRDGEGHVTIMVHTFVASSDEEAKRLAREPMKTYLRSALALIRDAAWEFPTFRKFSAEGERSLEDFFAQGDPQEIDDLLEFAFERYYRSNSFIGSVEKCVAFADDLKSAGADEIGCLIDFGIDEQTVMEHLPFLDEVRGASNPDADEPVSVSQAMVMHAVTHLQCTPSRASMILYEPSAEAGLRNLDCLMIGGEPLSADLVRKLKDLTSARMFNMYGPTETTIWSTVGSIDDQEDASFIGTPLANQTVHVIDPRGHPVPPGVVGELAIGGPGVTNGYLGRSELNRERFVEVPGVGCDPVSVYRTGDLVCLTLDGCLRFLGRDDDQVKVRGFRIEPGEIEACMLECTDVRAAAAVVQAGNTPEAIIVGFYVPKSGASVSDELNARLRGQLPDHMVPSHLAAVPDLPYLPNGKLDRRQLEQTEIVRKARQDAVLPETETERTLAEIWETLLNVEGISITDNFFELGGHSLLAIQAIDKIEKTIGVRLNPRKVLTNTLEQLAQDCVTSRIVPRRSQISAFGRLFGRNG